MNNDFDGVFRFTNWSDVDFVALWNNKEYTFPAKKTVPLIILGESLEGIQEIRKRFAYRLAQREFYNNNIKLSNGKTYLQLSKMGNGIPPTYNEKDLEPYIQKALEPLPEDRATVKEVQRTSNRDFKASKAISEKDNPNFIFREESENTETLGKMPDREV